MNEHIVIIKLDPQGKEMWRYEGDVIERGKGWLKVEALFNRNDMPFMGTTLKRGDRFVEMYYSDRWYNIFKIFDRDDGALKGWYCNVTRPAVFTDGRIEYVDLFLDLWVSVDGTQTVLDEDEFAAARLDEETRRMARQALNELKERFKS